MNLIIFADDLTGTLDTGVQFAKAGIRASYYSRIEALTSSLADGEADVYLFDTESRHLSPKAAYQKLFEAAEAVHAYHPDLILKKTDSGLRGNIGSELAAVMDAVQTPVLHFFPAYPRMGRTTENGIQYIDGTPVSQSTFGSDPFEPVTRDSAVTIAAGGGKAGWNAPGSWNGQDGIVVWDARDDEELFRRAVQVWDLQRRSGQTAVWAGCAGVAEVLANLLPFPKKIPGIPLLEFQVFFLCQVLLKQSSIQFVGGFLFDFFQHFLSTSSCVFSLIMLSHATYFYSLCTQSIAASAQ